MSEFITQKELADIVGVSKQYIGKLVKEGVFNDCFKGKKLDKKCALETYYLFKSSPVNKQSLPKSKVHIENELEDLLAAAQSPIHKVQIQKDY